MNIIPSHDIAEWLLNIIDKILEPIGLDNSIFVEEICYVLVVILGGFLVAWLLRIILLFVVKKVIELKGAKLGKELLESKFFTRLSHIIPPIIFLTLIPVVFASGTSILLKLINVIVSIYLSITIGVAVCAFLSFMWKQYDSYRNDKNHPLRGVLNVSKGLVWIIIAVVEISWILNKSPVVLLTGLGAFAAALMLVFKDSILGFVAGVQLSQNDMLRVGDWIIVPSTIANGIVEDVSLTVVKVRNWDNTLVMLPPYTLVSTSFQNWRGMIDAKVRLITQSVIVDNNSVKRTSSEYITKIKEIFPSMKSILDKGVKYEGGFEGINGCVDTNLGVFRFYLCNYILNHEMISKQWQILVNLLNSTNYGTPLQIYCYVKTTDWAIYESVQSEIIEHVISIAPQFDLVIYNSISRDDLHLCV